MASNSVNYSRIKYIRNYYYIVRELVLETHKLEIVYINTSAIVANYMTKPIGPNKFALVPTILGLAPEVVI